MTVKQPVQNIFLLNLLLFLTFDLMILGSGVRTMDAGLTCPDWPLCFGKVLPKYHFGVYLEFIHRAIAGLVGILYMVFFIKVWKNSDFKKIRVLSVVGLLFLLAQIIMGGLTVLKLLEAYIVTMHLTLATIFLICLFVMKKILAGDSLRAQFLVKGRGSSFFRTLVLVSSFFVLVQIVLGGLVASTYSGLVCIDFPTCNGQYFPELVGPIGIQMAHRFGAYWLGFLITSLFFFVILRGHRLGLGRRHKRKVAHIFFLLAVQIFVGIMNLKFLMPAFLSVLHLAIALTILVSLIGFYFSFKVERPRRGSL